MYERRCLVDMVTVLDMFIIADKLAGVRALPLSRLMEPLF